MKIIIRHSLSVIVLTVIALRIYLHDPQPQYSGKKEVPGLNSPVEIFTDNYGVPHIFAENESDLFFAAGYQTARDRLFQLSLVISASRGTLASFFGNDFLERIFGYLGLIIGLPSTQPISQRKMTLLYFIKEIIFYSIFTLLPALIGALIGAYSNGLDLISIAKFGLSLFLSFITGLAFAYLVSSLYRISLPMAIFGGLFSILAYGFLIKDFLITPGLDWYITGNKGMLVAGIILPGLISIISTVLIHENYEPKVIQKIGYRDRLGEYTRKFEWSGWMSTPVIAVSYTHLTLPTKA